METLNTFNRDFSSARGGEYYRTREQVERRYRDEDSDWELFDRSVEAAALEYGNREFYCDLQASLRRRIRNNATEDDFWNVYDLVMPTLRLKWRLVIIGDRIRFIRKTTAGAA